MRPHNFGLLATAVLLAAAPASNPLARRYTEGETLRYVMKAVNGGMRYEVDATGTVKKDAQGRFFEEFAWSNLVVNGAAVTLPVGSAAFRQSVSLDPAWTPAIPNLAAIDPRLIGPVTDFLNFYVDLQLGIKQPALTAAGSHVVVPHDRPNSWADGKLVLIGEDAIDFDITLTAIDASAGIAVVTVRHVPSATARVQLPAEWMRAPVAGTPNNFVQVARTADGGYDVMVGKETFDVRLKVSLATGRIQSATMDNPVETVERHCSDAALTKCGAPAPHPIRRAIELALRDSSATPSLRKVG